MKKTTLIIIFDALMVVFLFFAYGPFSYYRELLITSAMATKSHKYIARTLYSEKTISYVMGKNTIQEVEENTNTEEIEIGVEIEDIPIYESIYEEQILKHNEDEEYKIIELSENNYFGYLLVVYDPSKISLAITPYLDRTGLILRNLLDYYGGTIGVNAGGFADAGGVGHGGTPTGTVIKDGKIAYIGPETGWPGGLIGFNKDHILVLTRETPYKAIENGMVDAVEFGPFLIVNGKSAITTGNGGSGLSSRTIIAQRQDGVVLFFVIDGRQPGYSIGISMSEAVELLERYNVYNAANLDGGASTTLATSTTLINKPCGIGGTGERRLPNAWMIK